MNSEAIGAQLCIRDIKEVEGLLRRTESHFRDTCDWIVNNVERDAKAVIFHRILYACTNYIRAPRIISTNGKSCGHKKAAKEAAEQQYIILAIDEFP